MTFKHTPQWGQPPVSSFSERAARDGKNAAGQDLANVSEAPS